MLHTYKIWTNYDGIKKLVTKEMRHVDPQAAVEEAIETYDRNGDMYFARNAESFSDVIIFCEDEEGCITKWDLTVETVPQYYAKEVK